jgi:hypothetical protein
MKSLCIKLAIGLILMASVAKAHDLKYTLIQNGATPVANCTSKQLGATQVEFFKAVNSSEGYIVFSTVDEDAQAQREHVIKAKVSQKRHDVEVFRDTEVVADLVVVGEGSTPGFLKLPGNSSALKIWLKTYAQGHDLFKAELECQQLQ